MSSTKTVIQPNHKCYTRRDLLAQGFISYAATLVMPSALTMISRKAYGAESDGLVCSSGAAAAAGQVPFLIFDLSGGANIAGTNVIVGDKGGQLSSLPAGSYATIGLDATGEAAMKATPDTTYGLAMHPASQMLAGIKGIEAASTAKFAGNVEGALFCTVSGDDTNTNPHNPLYWLARAGLGGSLVSLIGSSNSKSGGNSAAPATSIDPTKQPSVVTKPADAAGLVDPGTLAKLLGTATAPDSASVQKVMKAIRTMSESKLRQFQAQDVPVQIQQLVSCGYLSSEDYLSKFTAAALDPTKDTTVSSVFTALATDGTQQAAGTIAKLVLDGYAGGGVVTLGGYDYHGQGRAAQNAKDLAAGQMIGRVLAVAAAKKKPIMIYVYTDGGVSAGGGAATNGLLAFANDDGQRSSAFTLVYNPTAKPVMRESQAGKGRQIGAFTGAGAVDTTAAVTSTSVENLTKAVTANWLALHGQESTLAAKLGDNPFGANYENYLAFTKIV